MAERCMWFFLAVGLERVPSGTITYFMISTHRIRVLSFAVTPSCVLNDITRANQLKHAEKKLKFSLLKRRLRARALGSIRVI